MLRVISLVVLGLAALVAHAPRAAAGKVGVVVTGEAQLQQPLVAQIEGWLRGHGYQLEPLALEPSATTRLVDCLTIDDGSCARGVVEAAARSESIVYASTKRERSSVTLTIYWIVKGRPAVGGRRGCEECTEDVLRGAADDLIASLAPAATSATGRLKLDSKPTGMIVMLDGNKVGVTPLERDIAVGEHSIVLVDGGTQVGERKIKILAGATAEFTMPVVYPPNNPKYIPPVEPSRLPPILCWVGGALLAGGSGVAFYYGQKGWPPDKYSYPGTMAAGFALAGASAAAVGVGVWFWVRGSRETAPIAAVGPGGGYLGWSGRF